MSEKYDLKSKKSEVLEFDQDGKSLDLNAPRIFE